MDNKINCPFHKKQRKMGGIGCVIETINPEGGVVYTNKNRIKAYSDQTIEKGHWVRIIKKDKKNIKVAKINVQLASCCC